MLLLVYHCCVFFMEHLKRHDYYHTLIQIYHKTVFITNGGLLGFVELFESHPYSVSSLHPIATNHGPDKIIKKWDPLKIQ